MDRRRRILGLLAAECLLVAVVDAWHAGDGEQDCGGQHRAGVAHLAGDAVDVVIAHEGLHRHRGGEPGVALQCVGELPEVHVMNGAPRSFPQLICRDRIEVTRAPNRREVTVEDLTQKSNVGKRSRTRSVTVAQNSEGTA